MNTRPRSSTGMTTFAIAIVLLGATLMGGCTYQGGDVSPLMRKLTWYSYLNADDLRQQCGTTRTDTLRLVYNAIHTEQIRTYDITIPHDNLDALLQARVLEPAYLSKISSQDLLAQWRGDKATTYLREEDTARLWSAMENSGVFEPAPEGLFVTSEAFFWLTAICRNGVFSYNAYVWPSDRFEGTQFSALLFAWDMTEIPVNPPRRATPLDIYGEASPRQKTGGYYQLTVDENGLK